MEVHRCIVFLRSDQQIGWPRPTWSHTDPQSNAPSALPILLMVGGVFSGMLALYSLIVQAWGAAVVLAVVGVAGWWGFLKIAKHDEAAHQKALVAVGDPTAFPFLHQDEYNAECRRQRVVQVGTSQRQLTPLDP